jgi:hypothetical protein
MIFLVFVALAMPAGAVLADPFFDTVVEENETINNDVIVFDGDLEIEDGGVVNGDVIVFNGDAELAGTINGDLVIFNGDLDAQGQATIQGDCVLLNGDVDDESLSGVRCTNIEGGNLSGITKGLPAVPAVPPVPAIPAIPDVPSSPQPPTPPVFVDSDSGWGHNPFVDFLRAISSSLLLGLLAFGVTSAFPEQMSKVKSTVRKKPVSSGAVGLLTAVAVPSIAVLLAIISAVLIIICIGILGFPLILILLLAFVAALLMGWIAIGSWFAGRLFRKNKWSPAKSAAIGTILLTFGLGLLGIVTGEWLQILLSTILSSIGLGAVALTQFGRRSYPRAGVESDVEEDEDKVNIVLNTLPDDDM